MLPFNIVWLKGLIESSDQPDVLVVKFVESRASCVSNQPLSSHAGNELQALSIFLHNTILPSVSQELRRSFRRLSCLVRAGPPWTAQAIAINQQSRAYWRADAKKESLQRVYGVTFPDKKLMADYQHRMEEAKKRDHRTLGLNQELFFFHQLTPGSAFFLPHGTRIYNTLMGVRLPWRRQRRMSMICLSMWVKC